MNEKELRNQVDLITVFCISGSVASTDSRYHSKYQANVKSESRKNKKIEEFAVICNIL